MLDPFNHLAVFGLLFLSISITHAVKYKDDIYEFPLESFFLWIVSSACAMTAIEIASWSIWYLSGVDG